MEGPQSMDQNLSRILKVFRRALNKWRRFFPEKILVWREYCIWRQLLKLVLLRKWFYTHRTQQNEDILCRE